MDISKILEDWPFDALNLSARRFVGQDGKIKIQMRIDLGIIQMEYHDRPDGKRPHAFPSLLDYLRSQAETEDDFQLSNKMVFELRQEAIQYYHRYLSLHQLKDYKGVVRDTRHNLDILSFISRYASSADNFTSQQHRPHVMMMNTSAKVMQKVEENDTEEALRILRIGINQIRNVYSHILDEDQPELTPEIYQLKELQHRITDDSIPNEIPPIEKLEIDLQMALLLENYEQAATIRDQIERNSE